MIRLPVLIFWISSVWSLNIHAQKNHLFTSLEEALAVPADSVYRLDLSKNRYTSLPKEVLTFKNLQELDLSKNKLTDLPSDFIFEHLQMLHLTKNKFAQFPEVLCQNKSLTQLYIGKNKLSALPECIGNLSNLVILDVWFNTISDLPESLTQLRKLRSMDLRGMNYSKEFQEKWRKLLPWVEIDFEVGCDCGY